MRAGSTLDYSGGTVVYVDTIYIHPNHTVTYDYDLAVLKLSVPVTLSSAVGVASLPVQQDQSFVPASNAALTGWGGPSTVCTEYTQLQYAAINLYANSYCQSNYANDLINDRLLCSEYASGDSTATCIVSRTMCWDQEMQKRTTLHSYTYQLSINSPLRLDLNHQCDTYGTYVTMINDQLFIHKIVTINKRNFNIHFIWWIGTWRTKQNNFRA